MGITKNISHFLASKLKKFLLLVLDIFRTKDRWIVELLYILL